MRYLSFITFFYCLILPFLAFSQEERIDDAYMPMPESERKTSPAFNIISANFVSTQANINANGMNIMNDAANEPSMAIDPNNPNRIMIGWRQFDNIQSNFRQAGYAFSSDGGLTWTGEGLIEAGVFRSDPVLSADNNGRFYYNSLAIDPYRCFVHRADSLGQWDNGVLAFGGDKQWMTIDNTGGEGEGNIYTNWNQYFTYCTGTEEYSRSTNSGDTYDACTPIPDEIHWGNIHVGPTGTVYVAGNEGVVAYAENAKKLIETTLWKTTFANLNGQVSTGGINPQGLTGQVWMESDHSTGPNQGMIYIGATVRPYGGTDFGEFMFNSSADQGETWNEEPVRINDDTGDNWQWMGALSVAPNGRIDAVWLDTRDNPGTFLSSLYYSFSLDGGATWSINERLSDEFDPQIGWPQQEKMGDYFHLISDNEGANLAWCGTFNGEQDVYFGRISQNAVPTGAPNKQLVSIKNTPNPFVGQTQFKIQSAQQEAFSIRIFNQIGQSVCVLEGKAGQEMIDWDGKNASGLNVAKGVYFAKISLENGGSETISLMKQ